MIAKDSIPANQFQALFQYLTIAKGWNITETDFRTLYDARDANPMEGRRRFRMYTDDLEEYDEESDGRVMKWAREKFPGNDYIVANCARIEEDMHLWRSG